MGKDSERRQWIFFSRSQEEGSEDRLDFELKRVGLVLGWMLALAGGLWALMKVWPAIAWTMNVLSPFLIALVIAYIFNPVVNFFQRKLKLGRVMGIIVVGLLIATLVLGFFGLLLPILITQGRSVLSAVQEAMPRLFEAVKSAAESIEARFSDGSLQEFGEWAKQWRERLNLDFAKISEQFGSALGGISQGGGNAIGGVFGAIGTFFTSMVGAVFTGIFAVVIAFYYLLEFDAIPRLIRTILPTEIEDRTMEVLHKVDVAMGGFLRGQLIVCSLIGLLTTIGLSAIGMYKYALIVGVIAGSANFIPYLGPTMGATPAILWALFSQSHETWGERGLYVGLILGLFALIQMIDGYVFQPKIVGKSANLHPLVVMGSLLIGAQFGVGGMIIAVPSACIGRVLFKELWWDEHLERKKQEKAERDATAGAEA